MKKTDILNRNEFVQQLVNLTENISDNKSNACFAINGRWGSGKSFVLDMFEEKLNTDYSEKYFTVRYNSWKYDYYEEPLISITSAVIAEIDKKTSIIPKGENKQKLLGVLEKARKALLDAGLVLIKEKTGIDVKKLTDIVADGLEEGKQKHKDENEYDTYFRLNKAIGTLSESIREIAGQYTVVIIVDEIDRCLPEYGVKVLERLHHLSEGKKNIITAIAVDKSRLMCGIKNIFGIENPEKYLEKFFDFEIKLDLGRTSEKFMEKYADYISLFDYNLFPFAQPAGECLSELFKEIDIRTQEHLMNKVIITHKMLFSDKRDYTFMCMEVLLAVMIGYYQDESCFDESSVDTSSYENIFKLSNRKKTAFSGFFKEKFENVSFKYSHRVDSSAYVLPKDADLYGMILYTWDWIHSKRGKIIYQCPHDSLYPNSHKNYEDLKKFAKMFRMIS